MIFLGGLLLTDDIDDSTWRHRLNSSNASKDGWAHVILYALSESSSWESPDRTLDTSVERSGAAQVSPNAVIGNIRWDGVSGVISRVIVDRSGSCRDWSAVPLESEEVCRRLKMSAGVFETRQVWETPVIGKNVCYLTDSQTNWKSGAQPVAGCQSNFERMLSRRVFNVTQRYPGNHDWATELKTAIDEIFKLNPKPGGQSPIFLTTTGRKRLFAADLVDGELQLSLNSVDIPNWKSRLSEYSLNSIRKTFSRLRIRKMSCRL